MGNKLTIAERTNSHHRSHIILHCDSATSYFAEFETVEQLDFFAQTLGFSYKAVDWYESDLLGIVRNYELDRKVEDGGYFWRLDELPAGAKPIKALSNGSIVTCYFTNNGKRVKLYRPNPNATAVFHPLTIEHSIAHCAIYGQY